MSSLVLTARPRSSSPLVSLVLARRSSLVLCLSRPHSLVLAPRPRHSSSLVLAALLARPRPPLVLTHPRCSSSLVLAARPRSSSSSPLVLGRRRRSSSVVVVARPRSSSPLVLSHASSLTRPLSLILTRSSSLARPRSLILSRSSSLPCPQTCPRHVAPRARASPTRFGRSLLCQAKRASQNPFVGSWPSNGVTVVFISYLFLLFDICFCSCFVMNRFGRSGRGEHGLVFVLPSFSKRLPLRYMCMHMTGGGRITLHRFTSHRLE